MTRIAVFDFDGTIYKKDSLIEFCKYIYGRNPWRIFFIFFQIGALLLYKFKFISTTKFKQLFLIYLMGIDASKLQKFVADFWLKERTNMNEQVLKLAQKAKDENAELIVASASPDFMLTSFSHSLGFSKCIATITTYTNNVYKIQGLNCRANQKYSRLEQAFPQGFEIVYAVSDNHDDSFILSKAQFAFSIVAHQLKSYHEKN